MEDNFEEHRQKIKEDWETLHNENEIFYQQKAEWKNEKQLVENLDLTANDIVKIDVSREPIDTA